MTTLERRRNWKISVYGREHGAPHVHLEGPGYRATLEISSGALLTGSAPATVLTQARIWLADRRNAVMAQWKAHNPTL